jgi:DNA-binding SARP family transcriptional activator/tetratricopeptide (TPR) repeat protein
MDIRLLGAVEICSRGVVLDPGPPQQRLVLAALAADAGRPVTPETLIDRVWDRAPAGSRRTLHMLVSRLRRVLREAATAGQSPPVLDYHGGGYRLRISDDNIDAHRFDRLVRHARTAQAGSVERVELLRQALALWQGEPLLGLPGQWAGQTRTTWRTLHLEAVVAWAHAEIEVGEPVAVIGPLTALTATYPLAEPLVGALMHAMHAAGRFAEALDVYTALRHRLADELGTDPGPGLQAVYRAVLGHDPARGGGAGAPTLVGQGRVASQGPLEAHGAQPVETRSVTDGDGRATSVAADQAAPPAATTPAATTVPAATLRTAMVPAQLPLDVRGFAGRADALAVLDSVLHDASVDTAATALVVVSGSAGVGKTCLAVHWAHRVLDRFPDGQLYVNLRGFDPGGTAATPADVVWSFLEALGVAAQRVPAGLDAQTALYRSALADRRMLVLLDNARDAEQVRPLLPGAPGCVVLVTSRDPLTGLVAGAGAVPLPLDLLDPDEARDLFTQRLGVDRIAAETVAVDAILDWCVRLPLALAVVAARAATQSQRPLATLAVELRDLQNRLDALATGDVGTDVRSAFSWSCRLLSEPAARLFRLLGLHPGPDLSVSAAASLAGLPPAGVRPVLAELARAHLVTERVPGRYSQHDLLRAYAGELAGSNELEADRHVALTRLLDHYLHGALRADAVLMPTRSARIEPIAPLPGITLDDLGSAAAAADWFAAEYPALVAAVQLAIDAGLDRHAWELVWSMSPHIERHHGFHGAAALHQVALQAARRMGDLDAQGYSHRMCGHVCTVFGEYDEAQAHLEQALDVYRQLGDDVKQGHVYLGLSHFFGEQGRPQDALHQDEQALARFRTSGNRFGQGLALDNLSWFHTQLGNYETALDLGEQALSLHQEGGHRRGEASCWHSLGLVYHHLGRHADAVDAYQQSLALTRDLGLRHQEAALLVHLGDTHEARGHTDSARACWRQALDLYAEFDHSDAEQVRAKLRSAL